MSWRRLLLVLVVAVLAGAYAVWRLPLTYDLAWFLPTPASVQERVLVERVGQGPGAQLLFLDLADARLAPLVEAPLRALAGVQRVLPEAAGPRMDQLPALLRSQYPLLVDLPTDATVWSGLLEEREADLRAMFDEDVLELLALDPALALSGLAGQLAEAQPDLASLDPSIRLLVTTVPVFDLAGQQALIAAVRAVVAAARVTAGLPPAEPQLYGAGAYSVELSQTVRFESVFYSVLASVALLLLVCYRFRSPLKVSAVGVPLLAGAAAGALALSLGFSQVHGITLAFGFTLLGVVIDYPLHLLSFRHPAAVWPTLRLGIISTLLAYLGFLGSGTSGIAQLGLFAAAGIAGAALASAFLFPASSRAPDATLAAAPVVTKAVTKAVTNVVTTAVTTVVTAVAAPAQTYRLDHRGWLLALTLGAAGVLGTVTLNGDLGALTPIPESSRRAEGALRTQFATMDQRYVVAVSGADAAAALEGTAAVAEQLEVLRQEGLLEGVQALSTLVPAQALQAERRQRLPAVRRAFESALSTSAFQPATFAPFLAALEAQIASSSWLTVASLRTDPSLNALRETQLYPVAEGVRGLLFLRGVADPALALARFNALKRAQPALAATAVWVDLKAASQDLVGRYQQRFVWLLAAIAVLLLGVLAALTRDLPRSLWCLGSLTAAVTLTACISAWINGPLALFELIALMLVAGLGLDYALFFSGIATASNGPAAAQRQVLSAEPVQKNGLQQVRRAVGLCAVSSLLVFGILALSSIPLLRGLGLTVAVGVALAYLLARLGVREVPHA